MNNNLESSETYSLSFAIAKNDIEMIKMKTVSDKINLINSIGITPLITAIIFNNETVVEFLIKNGADVNQNSLKKLSPLMYACDNGNYKIVNLLINNKADVNYLDENGYNVLHHLVNNFMIEDLSVDYDSLYALSNIFSKNLNPRLTPINSRIACIDLLKKANIDIDYSNKDISALSIALEGCGKDYTELLDKLISVGAIKKAVEISPDLMYQYRGMIDLKQDLRYLDFSMWPMIINGHLHFLEYTNRIKKYEIEVSSIDKASWYKRPKYINNKKTQ